MGPFIQDNENKIFIPDPTTKKGKGRRQTRRIRNGMDESEVSKAQKHCSQCGALSHNYKKCPQNALHDAADVGLVEGIRCHDPQLYFIICNM